MGERRAAFSEPSKRKISDRRGGSTDSALKRDAFLLQYKIMDMVLNDCNLMID